MAVTEMNEYNSSEHRGKPDHPATWDTKKGRQVEPALYHNDSRSMTMIQSDIPDEHKHKIRTVTCRHWRRGRCDLGDRCYFAHHEDTTRRNSIGNEQRGRPNHRQNGHRNQGGPSGKNVHGRRGNAKPQNYTEPFVPSDANRNPSNTYDRSLYIDSIPTPTYPSKLPLYPTLQRYGPTGSNTLHETTPMPQYGHGISFSRGLPPICYRYPSNTLDNVAMPSTYAPLDPHDYLSHDETVDEDYRYFTTNAIREASYTNLDGHRVQDPVDWLQQDDVFYNDSMHVMARDGRGAHNGPMSLSDGE